MKLEDGFRPTGWLGALAGTLLYFDFSDDGNFQQGVHGLLNELGTAATPAAPGGADAHAAPLLTETLWVKRDSPNVDVDATKVTSPLRNHMRKERQEVRH